MVPSVDGGGTMIKTSNWNINDNLKGQENKTLSRIYRQPTTCNTKTQTCSMITRKAFDIRVWKRNFTPFTFFFEIPTLFYESIFNLFLIFPGTLNPTSLCYVIFLLLNMPSSLESKWGYLSSWEVKHWQPFWLHGGRAETFYTWHLLPLIPFRVFALHLWKPLQHHFKPSSTFQGQ